MSVYRLVYASSAAQPFGLEDLRRLARTSRANNTMVNVTGALLYHDGNIMQALEGAPEAVEAIFRRIEGDPRHGGVLALLRETGESRAFPDWAMGIVRPEDVPEEGVGSLFDMATPGPERAQRLLHAFRLVTGR